MLADRVIELSWRIQRIARYERDEIAKKIGALRTADGVAGIEQCAVAVRLAGTKEADVIPGVKIVGNGWISLAAYQAKGYGYIAP